MCKRFAGKNLKYFWSGVGRAAASEHDKKHKRGSVKVGGICVKMWYYKNKYPKMTFGRNGRFR